MATIKAHATPTKDFFVRMITKDISLEDCILDLIDNCLDGARKVKHAVDAGARVFDYTGFHAVVEFSPDHFRISDNCGGISILEASNYAFHFGRRANMPSDGDYSIGLYGIGMKRAIFKIGNLITIHSSTDKEAFNTQIDVAAWLAKTTPEQSSGQSDDEWDFDLEIVEAKPTAGTEIFIRQLAQGASSQFVNPAFANSLARIIGRDYAQFIAKGFEIILNGHRVEGFPFTVRESTEFKPVRIQYKVHPAFVWVTAAGYKLRPPQWK